MKILGLGENFRFWQKFLGLVGHFGLGLKFLDCVLEEDIDYVEDNLPGKNAVMVDQVECAHWCGKFYLFIID